MNDDDFENAKALAARKAEQQAAPTWPASLPPIVECGVCTHRHRATVCPICKTPA